MFALFVTWFVKVIAFVLAGVTGYFTRKVIIFTAATAAVLACFVSLVLTIKTLVAAAFVSIPAIIAAGLAMILPANTAVVIAGMFSMYFAASLGIMCKQYIKQWTSTAS